MGGNSFFIVVEGLDGTGKSSITRRLVRVLEATLGRYVKLTFEPHDPSCSGLFIRQVLMKKITNIPPRTLALAFAANRADHCDREISSFLDQANGKGRVVICDRYYLSSLVYQSSNDFGFEDIMALNSSVRVPDLTIFLNASSRTCYERMRNRGEDKELFEINLNQVRQKYLDAISYLRSRGESVVTLEAEGTLTEVFDRVKIALFDNSPKWLKVQTDLPFYDIEAVFYPSNYTLDEALSNIQEKHISSGMIDLQNAVQDLVNRLSYVDAATLFLDVLKRFGYTVHSKLPWTDLDAYELSISLPLGVTQRGTALLLGESQRYDSVMTKLLGSKYELVGGMSDFIFIFDSNPSHLQTNYYEREKIVSEKTQRLSPTFNVLGRTELAEKIVGEVLKNMGDFSDENKRHLS